MISSDGRAVSVSFVLHEEDEGLRERWGRKKLGSWLAGREMRKHAIINKL